MKFIFEPGTLLLTKDYFSFMQGENYIQLPPNTQIMFLDNNSIPADYNVYKHYKYFPRFLHKNLILHDGINDSHLEYYINKLEKIS